jgi:hypothetical protein
VSRGRAAIDDANATISPRSLPRHRVATFGSHATARRGEFIPTLRDRVRLMLVRAGGHLAGRHGNCRGGQPGEGDQDQESVT